MGPGCAPLARGLAEAHRPAAVFRGGSSRSGLTVGAGQQGWGLATGLALGPRTPWQVWSGRSGRSLPSSGAVAIDAPSRTPGVPSPAGMFLGLWGEVVVGVGMASSRPGGRGGEEGAAVQPPPPATPGCLPRPREAPDVPFVQSGLVWTTGRQSRLRPGYRVSYSGCKARQPGPGLGSGVHCGAWPQRGAGWRGLQVQLPLPRHR